MSPMPPIGLTLLHLPVVVVFQILVGHLPLHWSAKFPIVLGVSLALLFASYRYLVRPTIIGQVLNGRRYPRGLVRDGVGATTSAPDSISAPADAPMASLRDVHKRYGTTVALAGLDLDIRPGEVLAVLGPNGAGKSTAISLLLGLLEPDKGTASLFGRAPVDVTARRRVGVMMQDVALTLESRVRELYRLGVERRRQPAHRGRDTGAHPAHRPGAASVRHAPGGQKRSSSSGAGRTRWPQPPSLDEPTAGGPTLKPAKCSGRRCAPWSARAAPSS